MDTVRFGRALGMGARGVAKAMLAAADAAASPNTSISAPSPTSTVKPHVPLVSVTSTAEQLREVQAGVARGGRRFNQAFWRPLLRLGGVLCLEVTGVFFGLFVFFAVTNAWNLRSSVRETTANHIEHRHFLWSVAMAALFGYFCASSFLRASRRGRNH